MAMAILEEQFWLKSGRHHGQVFQRPSLKRGPNSHSCVLFCTVHEGGICLHQMVTKEKPNPRPVDLPSPLYWDGSKYASPAIAQKHRLSPLALALSAS